MDITIAHSPDADDAFMFYALTCGRIATDPYRIHHVLSDIETLNRAAKDSTYEISAISLHAFPFVSENYELLPCGASVGDNYGPMIVSKKPMNFSELIEKCGEQNSSFKIAVPGEWTTAFLVLKLMLPHFNFQVMRFDEIIPACAKGEVSAGLIIHEGQLTYRDHGLKKVVDLGEWWRKETGLPLPLGANVIRKNLGASHIRELAKLMRKSVEFALSEENLKGAMNYAKQFARDLDSVQVERFVRMYVNRRTLDLDPETIEAINLLYTKAAAKGFIPKQKNIQANSL